MEVNRIKVTPKWSKSKEQIWAEKFEHVVDDRPVLGIYRRKWFAYVAAAVVAIVIALPATAYLYTNEVVVPCGEHLAVILPEGSRVELNADSRLKYKPLWWHISRSVELTGEGYFEVVKGSRFVVNSPNGTVAVLGTSFNVLSRDKHFDVVCLTGKVKVTSKTEMAILTPDMRTQVKEGKLVASLLENPAHSIAWTQGKFYFEDAPLGEVIKEIERQYNIKIAAPSRTDYFYTGNFSRDKSPEEVLRIVGKPFGITLTVE